MCSTVFIEVSHEVINQRPSRRYRHDGTGVTTQAGTGYAGRHLCPAIDYISYLEQLFARLRQHGLVTGMRGPGGGYCLARPAGEITIANILATVDDVSRREEQPHTQGEIPAGGQLWMHLSNRIYDYLDSITLEEAVASSSGEGKESEFGSGFQQTAA